MSEFIITNNVSYVGVDDNTIDLFEGQYVVPDGISYNSYVVFGEKIAVTDTVESRFGSQWLKNIKDATGGREPDYLIVQHMEPDHSSNIAEFLKAFPNAKIVANSKAFTMMKNYYGIESGAESIVVDNGSTLDLGGGTELQFITAPMVHWPEVTFTYMKNGGILFSADAFGKFGTDKSENNWVDEARRYYFGIVGKYGPQVQAALKKLDGKQINTVCPLHGPVLKGKLSESLDFYGKWSTYTAEEDGVFIAYTSIYGNTEKAVKKLADELKKLGKKVIVSDLARSDWAENVANAFKYSKLVLATTTYNADIFPPMRAFISALAERNFQNRTVALIENGSWAPIAAKKMTDALSACKNLIYAENTVTLRPSLDAAAVSAVKALAEKL